MKLMLTCACLLASALVLHGSGAATRPASAVLANASGNALLAGFVGALLGELVGKTILHRSAQKELAAEEELRRQQLTERDETQLKAIATGIEEFRVDHGGAYPKTLADLPTIYLNAGTRMIPGSDPIAYYTYEYPASDPSFGGYDIKDNGTFDPTLDRLHNALDHSLCTRQTCRYIIYLENAGLFGI